MQSNSTYFTSQFKHGDEVAFQFSGLLTGTVKRVSFRGRKIRYEIEVTATFEVPASDVLMRADELPMCAGIASDGLEEVLTDEARRAVTMSREGIQSK